MTRCRSVKWLATHLCCRDPSTKGVVVQVPSRPDASCPSVHVGSPNLAQSLHIEDIEPIGIGLRRFQPMKDRSPHHEFVQASPHNGVDPFLDEKAERHAMQGYGLNGTAVGSARMLHRVAIQEKLDVSHPVRIGVLLSKQFTIERPASGRRVEAGMNGSMDRGKEYATTGAGI